MKTVTGTIKDKAGNQQSCNLSLGAYVDKTPPTCGTASGSSTSWTKNNRTVTQACSDSHSGCVSASTAVAYSTTTKTANITIRDKVGNSKSCPVNVYVDKIAPTYTVKYVSNSNGLHPYCKKTACVAEIKIMDPHSGIAQRVIVKHDSISKKGKSFIVNHVSHTPCEIDPFREGCPAHGLTPGSNGDLLCGHPRVDWTIYAKDAVGNSVTFSGFGQC